MAATGPDPVSVRIVNPFNQWSLARPGFLEADGNSSATTATVEVEIRYVDTLGNPQVLPGNSIGAPPPGPWLFEFDLALAPNFPSNVYVGLVAIASNATQTGEDACSVYVSIAGRVSKKASRSRAAKMTKRTKRAKGRRT